jgi:hypothetical protein
LGDYLLADRLLWTGLLDRRHASAHAAVCALAELIVVRVEGLAELEPLGVTVGIGVVRAAVVRVRLEIGDVVG